MKKPEAGFTGSDSLKIFYCILYMQTKTGNNKKNPLIFIQNEEIYFLKLILMI